MKKWKLLVVVGAMVLGCAGCRAQETEVNSLPEETVEEVAVEEAGEESGQAESEAEEKNENINDLEEQGDSGEIAAFAEEIQAAVSNQDMEALAGLCSYPVAVNGDVVEDKDAFMELGADVIFTEDRCETIAAVDVQALEETMAGVVMGDATPNIIFKSVDGTLGITGIN